MWTLCRILKRSASYRKYVPDWKEMAAVKRVTTVASSSSGACDDQHGQSYISFSTAPLVKKQVSTETSVENLQQHQSSSSHSMYGDINELLKRADWEDLRSMIDCSAVAVAPTPTNPFLL